jgi:uncharacterized repeat protein (TIGR04138 family)
MKEELATIMQLLEQDQRYRLEAYRFVKEALQYAQDVMQMPSEPEPSGSRRHLTGQQLCEAIREFAREQYGFMAKLVFNSWGVYTTSDFGEIVYNLIRIKEMKKSKTDKRTDFDNVYDFDAAFQPVFELSNEKA